MGRLILLILALGIFLLGIWAVSKIIPLSGRQMTQEEKRKNFDDDIEAVAKKVKMRE